MNRIFIWLPSSLTLILSLWSNGVLAQSRYDTTGNLFEEVCSACHGVSMEGTNLGTPLVGVDLAKGDTPEQIIQSIGTGNAEKGMPAYAGIYDEDQIHALALYVLERRAGFNYDSYQMHEEVTIPEEVQQSKLHNYALTTITDKVDPLPYSIEPLPDDRFLIVEKKYGLRIVSADGELSDLIADTPKTWDDSVLPEALRALDRGKGWMQDVVLHPDYENNGWIYIYMGDRCDDCNAISREESRPVGMSKIVRGRIKESAWVDQQTIWATGYEHYTTETDLKLGGRLAIDNQGYVYFTVGAMNGFYDPEVQSLSRPWGKTHRVHDDGRIPMDNPYVDTPGAVQSIWTVGHRAPQGLEYDVETATLWGSEHGPRGGDEINLLVSGGNYGWPFVSNGVDYDGSSIASKNDIEFNVEDMLEPVVDMTPSPAISSFVIYHGEQFPNWQGNIIAGSLKAKTLYRFEIENGQLIERETLLSEVGRIRDVEVDNNGHILLVTENSAGSKILRMSRE